MKKYYHRFRYWQKRTFWHAFINEVDMKHGMTGELNYREWYLFTRWAYFKLQQLKTEYHGKV